MVDDERWMGVAIEEACAAAAAGEVPIGAVLVRGGELLARAHNEPIGACDPTAHAEILALRRGARRLGEYRLPGTTLYVTIEPCPMCFGAALWARVERLVFGALDPKAGAVGSVVDLAAAHGFNHRIEASGGVLAERAAELMRAFFRARR
jgi:tRNA(adenine34) deaminase